MSAKVIVPDTVYKLGSYTKSQGKDVSVLD